MRTPPLRRRTDPESGSAVSLRALVVDGDETYREYVASLVSRFRFDVTACADGAEAGDRILRDLGSLFLERTRSEDLIARYGGDEFVMLVATLSPPEVESLADRMVTEISSARWIFGTDLLTVGVTTGISCSSLLEQPTVAQLLSACDRDLYKNKWVRKNPDEDPSIYEYDTSRDAHVIELLTLTAEYVEPKKADG